LQGVAVPVSAALPAQAQGQAVLPAQAQGRTLHFIVGNQLSIRNLSSCLRHFVLFQMSSDFFCSFLVAQGQPANPLQGQAQGQPQPQRPRPPRMSAGWSILQTEY